MQIITVYIHGARGIRPSVTALTPKLCAFSGQSALVVATGAKKGLFANLKKPERIHLAPPTADKQTVDARNLACLVAAHKWPPPSFQVAPDSPSTLSYGGILLTLKTWNGSLQTIQTGVAANPKIPGHLFP